MFTYPQTRILDCLLNGRLGAFDFDRHGFASWISFDHIDTIAFSFAIDFKLVVACLNVQNLLVVMVRQISHQVGEYDPPEPPLSTAVNCNGCSICGNCFV